MNHTLRTRPHLISNLIYPWLFFNYYVHYTFLNQDAAASVRCIGEVTFRKWFYTLILFFTIISTGKAQETINGRVTNEQGKGLSAVTVLVKSTTTTTTTDADGAFSLQVPDSSSILVFTYRGFYTQEMAVKGRSIIMIKLAANPVLPAEEVVVVGYGTQRKEMVSGAIATVQGEELVKSPVLNLSSNLAGRLPGLMVVNRSGEPGNDGAFLYIRGNNALGDNSALVVIDGIPNRMGGLDRINPADIESISVLKDATAAIYGWRSANGVILVTTKKGSIGKPSLSYSFNQGFSNPTVLPKVTNAAQYTSLLNELNIYEIPVSEWAAANEAYKSTGSYTRPNGTIRKAPYSPQDLAKYQDGSDSWGHPNTDWIGATLKMNSPQVRHNVALNGGTEHIRYLASMGYLNQDAYYINSATGYKQYDLRINLDATINQYVKLDLGVLGRQEDRNTSVKPASTIFRMLMRGKPQEPAYWPNGLPGPALDNGENPVVITTQQIGYNRDKRKFLQTNGSLEIRVPGVQGLKLTARGAFDNYSQNTRLSENAWTLYRRGSGFEADGITPNLVKLVYGPKEPLLTLGNATQLDILLGGLVSYDKILENHTLHLLAGTNREISKSNYLRGNTGGSNSGGSFDKARAGYYGRVGYNYKKKYLSEFIWSYDGSDKFPKTTRFDFFPGLMLGWVVSEEAFWKRAVPIINFLKLHGSKGRHGNDFAIMPYSTKTTYFYRSTTTSNIGLEGQLSEGRITFELNVFSNLRTNFMGIVPDLRLPIEGFGVLRDKGWDFSAGYNYQKAESSFTVSMNGGYTRNEIISWSPPVGNIGLPSAVGKPMNTGLVYEYDGVFKDQSEIDANSVNYAALTRRLSPGDMKYRDNNGDGKITSDDRVHQNNSHLPLFQGGVNLEWRYKNVDFTILFQGTAGAKQYLSSGEAGTLGNYLLDVYENRWSIDQPSSIHPRITNRSNQYYSGGNTYWLRSTDYIRLKNLEIGYALPASLTSRFSMKSLRIYFNGFNLYTLDKLKVFDPEADNATGYYYPQQKILNMGLKVTF